MSHSRTWAAGHGCPAEREGRWASLATRDSPLPKRNGIASAKPNSVWPRTVFGPPRNDRRATTPRESSPPAPARPASAGRRAAHTPPAPTASPAQGHNTPGQRPGISSRTVCVSPGCTLTRLKAFSSCGARSTLSRAPPRKPAPPYRLPRCRYWSPPPSAQVIQPEGGVAQPKAKRESRGTASRISLR
jgi:hypothetical protein